MYSNRGDGKKPGTQVVYKTENQKERTGIRYRCQKKAGEGSLEERGGPPGRVARGKRKVKRRVTLGLLA